MARPHKHELVAFETRRGSDGYEYMSAETARKWVAAFFADFGGSTQLYALQREDGPPEFKLWVKVPYALSPDGWEIVTTYVARREGHEVRLVDLLLACRDVVLELAPITRLGPCH